MFHSRYAVRHDHDGIKHRGVKVVRYRMILTADKSSRIMMRYHAIEILYSVPQQLLNICIFRKGMLAYCGVTLKMARICTVRICRASAANR